jgi:K+-sensing histidine kinase KdpD
MSRREATERNIASARTAPHAGEENYGLGLAIVKHLVESQNGTVGADFPATGGNIFWFELPVA